MVMTTGALSIQPRPVMPKSPSAKITSISVLVNSNPPGKPWILASATLAVMLIAIPPISLMVLPDGGICHFSDILASISPDASVKDSPAGFKRLSRGRSISRNAPPKSPLARTATSTMGPAWSLRIMTRLPLTSMPSTTPFSRSALSRPSWNRMGTKADLIGGKPLRNVTSVLARLALPSR